MELFSWILIISPVLFGLHKIISSFYSVSEDISEVNSHKCKKFTELRSLPAGNKHERIDQIYRESKQPTSESRFINITTKKTDLMPENKMTQSIINEFIKLLKLEKSILFLHFFQRDNRQTTARDLKDMHFNKSLASAVSMTSRRIICILVFIVLAISIAKNKPKWFMSSLLSKKISSADCVCAHSFNKSNPDCTCWTSLRNNQTKLDWNCDWIYKPSRMVYCHDITFNSLTLLDSQRLASFRNFPISDLPSNLSFIPLADAGFRYSGRQDLTRCDFCGNEVNILCFLSGDTMLDPSSQMFHKRQCSSHKNGIEDDNGNKPTAVSDSMISKNESGTVQGNEDNALLGIRSGDTIVPQYSGHALQSDTAGLHSEINPVKNRCIDQYSIPKEDETKVIQDSSTPSLIGAVDSSQLKHLQATPRDDGYVSDDPNFVDSHHFNQECAFLANGKHTNSESFRQPIRNFECDKNPGHFAYFPMLSLKLEQLPGRLRHKDFLSFLQLFSLLTVRVVVNVTSSIRHWTDLAVKEKGNNCRTGTGWVSFDDFSRSAKETFPSSHAHGKWKTVKKYMKTLVKKNEGRVYIETNRHIVIDSHEAENTTVEFFYDDPSRRGVKVVKCVAVHVSRQPGDNRAILECKTGDYEFLQRLQEIRQKLKEMVEVLPRKIKSLMCKTLFIVHHPHGREKHLSYGDSVLIKYSLETTQDGKYRITKVNNQTSEGDLRKVLLYAADTCQGTSGAPVIGFQKGQMDANGMPTYLLNVWIHNGEEKFNNLGGTAMKELLPEDDQLFLSPSQQSETNEAESDTEAEEAALGKEPVCAPSLTVIAPPTYLKYASFDERVNSFLGVLITLIHSPVYFATAGFFYADYGDCVRCFQCGLGLRSWKPGDNVYEQHQKHRPDCQYLQAQLKNGIPTADDHWLSENVQSNESQSVKTPSDKCETYATYETESETIYNVRPMESPAKQCLTLDPGMTLDTDELTHSENEDATITEETNDTKLTMNLLLSENEKLRSCLLCKVCHKEPVKDLFLPCGELYACSSCSKLLTHCPSCNHQIMATVTTYLT